MFDWGPCGGVVAWELTILDTDAGVELMLLWADGGVCSTNGPGTQAEEVRIFPGDPRFCGRRMRMGTGQHRPSRMQA